MESESNQIGLLLDYAKAVLKQAYQNRFIFVFCFAIVSIAVLAVGAFYPKTFSSYSTLYADRTNIIQPLLSGSASVTRVDNQLRVVQEAIFSPRILQKVAERTGVLNGDELPSAAEKKINGIRGGLNVQALGPSLIKISYSSGDPDRTFDIVTAVVDEFIKDSSDSKKNESRQAYEFINNQVESYKRQLQEAEENLRTFKSNNTDGSESSVNQRISALRGDIESLTLDIEEAQTRKKTIEKELAGEAEFVSKQYEGSVYLSSLLEAQRQLDNLLLTYTDTHPDVVALKYKINDLKKSMAESENRDETNTDKSANVIANPNHQVLRTQLLDTKVKIDTLLKRKASIEKLLAEQYERLKRVAAVQAELAELTRDYQVTQGIYEDMLARKEKARLSMTLDIEGRGMSYKIQEPAVYPLSPTGIRFIHFAMVGPILGILFPFGALLGLIIIDPRVRFQRELNAIKNTEVMGVIPHMMTPLDRRVLKWDALVMLAVVAVVFLIYIVVGWLRLSGTI